MSAHAVDPTERVEVAGRLPGGDDVPDEVLRRLNANRKYRELFPHAFRP